MTDASVTRPWRGALASLAGFLSAAINLIVGLALTTVALAALIDMVRVIVFDFSPWFEVDTPAGHAFLMFAACSYLFNCWLNEEQKRASRERMRAFNRKEVAVVVQEMMNRRQAGKLN